MFDGAQVVMLRSITDGASNTLFVGEAIGSSIPWTMPGDVAIGACPTLGGSGFSRFIPNAVPFAFADGSVRFVPNDISCDTLPGTVSAV
jgi:prepilin-type processing-associated H-X9-DG protein